MKPTNSSYGPANTNSPDYGNYLKLDILLSAQKPLSFETDKPAHDEMLFISIHQAYEIWFKQLLFELDSILKIFRKPRVDEEEMGVLVSRAHRMNEIMRVLVHQVDILETMTPLDFLEFRDLIAKASGFQSAQFRLFENKLGLRANDRIPLGETAYSAHLSGQDQKNVIAAEKESSLYDLIETWLSRTPFLSAEGFQFWDMYKDAANIMFQKDTDFISSNQHLGTQDKEKLLANINQSRAMFETLFNEKLYEEKRARGEWRLSFRAVHAALLIQVYRDKPAFQLPYRLMTEVLDLDSLLTQWRYRHAIMVKRMLGSRVGTGGSSGAKYLQESAEKHRVFEDFYRLTTFFIPRSKLPDLPKVFSDKLTFRYE